MAVVSMQKVTLCALKKNRKAMLETLQRLGMVEVSNMETNDYGLEKVNLFNQMAVFEKSKSTAKKALEVLSEYSEQKSGTSLFKIKNDLSKEEYYKLVERAQEIRAVAVDIVECDKKIVESKAEILNLNVRAQELDPWLNLDISMQFKGTKKTAAFIGSIPGKTELSEILANLNAGADKERPNPKVEVDVISDDGQQMCIFVLCAKSCADETEKRLKEMEFSNPAVTTKLTPAEEKAKALSKIELLQKEIERNVDKIKSYEGKIRDIKFLIDYYGMRKGKYEVLAKLENSKRVFFLTGYIEKKNANKLETYLNKKFEVAIEFEEPSIDDDVPVAIENNKFASPVEGVLESYSLPARGEADPTSVMSIFYYVLFGLMLSDAAYGLIVTIACAIVLHKFKGMSSGLCKSLRMFMYCGVSTTFWGVMFGSYFGDVVDVVSGTFFGHQVSIPPLWFVPLQAPMFMLAFSFGIGIIHIFTGLAVKLYELIKAGLYKDAIFDVVSWYLLVGGLIAYMLSAPMVCNMLTINFVLPALAGSIGAVCAGVGAILIVLTGGRESKNPLKRFLKGLYSLYGITGYMGDILSYSRLLALGLATGVIAQVFNKMGTMAGNGILGAIVFIIVFAIGHTMNIGINLLGAYVHTNRLQFVEFFGKFYEGGGRKFSPFFANTKYFKVMEDTHNG